MANNSNLTNLDALAAQAAQKIVLEKKIKDKPKELDILATKVLGVLQENGPYAMALFLASRSRKVEQEIAEVIGDQLFSGDMFNALFGDGIRPPTDKMERMKFLSEEIAPHLGRLLLLKQVWEQTLIYVRYGAKARQQESDVKQPDEKQEG